jgi:hypothetical protein
VFTPERGAPRMSERSPASVMKCHVGGLGKLHDEAASAEVVSKLLAEQNLDIRLIVDHEK